MIADDDANGNDLLRFLDSISYQLVCLLDLDHCRCRSSAAKSSRGDSKDKPQPTNGLKPVPEPPATTKSDSVRQRKAANFDKKSALRPAKNATPKETKRNPRKATIRSTAAAAAGALGKRKRRRNNSVDSYESPQQNNQTSHQQQPCPRITFDDGDQHQPLANMDSQQDDESKEMRANGCASLSTTVDGRLTLNMADDMALDQGASISPSATHLSPIDPSLTQFNVGLGLQHQSHHLTANSYYVGHHAGDASAGSAAHQSASIQHLDSYNSLHDESFNVVHDGAMSLHHLPHQQQRVVANLSDAAAATASHHLNQNSPLEQQQNLESNCHQRNLLIISNEHNLPQATTFATENNTNGTNKLSLSALSDAGYSLQQLHEPHTHHHIQRHHHHHQHHHQHHRYQQQQQQQHDSSKVQSHTLEHHDNQQDSHSLANRLQQHTSSHNHHDQNQSNQQLDNQPQHNNQRYSNQQWAPDESAASGHVMRSGLSVQHSDAMIRPTNRMVPMSPSHQPVDHLVNFAPPYAPASHHHYYSHNQDPDSIGSYHQPLGSGDSFIGNGLAGASSPPIGHILLSSADQQQQLNGQSQQSLSRQANSDTGDASNRTLNDFDQRRQHDHMHSHTNDSHHLIAGIYHHDPHGHPTHLDHHHHHTDGLHHHHNHHHLLHNHQFLNHSLGHSHHNGQIHHILPIVHGIEPSSVILQDINLASASWSSPEDLYNI